MKGKKPTKTKQNISLQIILFLKAIVKIVIIKCLWKEEKKLRLAFTDSKLNKSTNSSQVFWILKSKSTINYGFSRNWNYSQVKSWSDFKNSKFNDLSNELNWFSSQKHIYD